MAEKTLPHKAIEPVLSRDEIAEAIDEELSVQAQGLMADSESEHTHAAYGRGWALYCQFWEEYGRRDSKTGKARRGPDPLPVSPEAECEFIAWMAYEGFKPPYIEVARAAVHRMHRKAGLPVPDGAKASAALRGYKRRLRRAGWRPRKASPARTYDLERFLGPVDLTTRQGKRDRSMITLGYAVAARRRVIVNLNLTDFREVRRGVFEVRIVGDKGDTNRTVLLTHWGEVQGGRCKDILCPVCATLEWLECLRELKIESGPMYRAVDRYDSVHGGPNALAGRPGAADGRLVLRMINFIFERLRKQAGLPKGFTPHSLRAGFATESYEEGGDPLFIKRQGGWADDSRSFQEYIRDVDNVKHSPLNNVTALRRATQGGR